MNLSDVPDEAVWPDPAYRPDTATRRAIRAHAEKLTESELRGYESLPPWYRRFVIAEERMVAARQQAKTVEGQRIDRLERTVAQQQEQIAALKKLVEVKQKRTIDVVLEAVGGALPKWAEDCRFLRDGGTWRDDAAYPRFSLVTDHSSGWVATRYCEPGERPPGDGWRLAIKRPRTEKAE